MQFRSLSKEFRKRGLKKDADLLSWMGTRRAWLYDGVRCFLKTKVGESLVNRINKATASWQEVRIITEKLGSIKEFGFSEIFGRNKRGRRATILAGTVLGGTKIKKATLLAG